MTQVKVTVFKSPCQSLSARSTKHDSPTKLSHVQQDCTPPPKTPKHKFDPSKLSIDACLSAESLRNYKSSPYRSRTHRNPIEDDPEVLDPYNRVIRPFCTPRGKSKPKYKNVDDEVNILNADMDRTPFQRVNEDMPDYTKHVSS